MSRKVNLEGRRRTQKGHTKRIRKGVRQLNQLQHRFVREYLSDPAHNASRAYMRAGYRAKDAHVASACAARLLDDARIQAELERAAAMLDEKLKADQATLVDQWVKAASTTVLDVFDQTARHDWEVKSNKKIDPASALAISKVVVRDTQFGRHVTVDLGRADTAADALARHLGMFTHRVELTGADGNPVIPISAIRALIFEADEDLEQKKAAAQKAAAAG